MFIREKKIDCGNYREVDIIPRSDDSERAVKGKRRKRHRISAPKQKELNDKNARRYLVQLGNGNFGKDDLHVTLTYSSDNLPTDPKQAEKTVNNYLRRVAYRRKRIDLPPLRYILVTEYKYSKSGDEIKRIHHHIIMNGGLSRDEVEMMWSAERINWKKACDPQYRAGIKKLGYANADRLQPNENGIEALCKYITKDPQGKKRWSSSRNLKRPIEQPPADHKYSRRKVMGLAMSNDLGKSYFEKQFSNYNITEINPRYNDLTGWHIYIKMWKKPKLLKNYGKDGGEYG